MKVNIEKLAKSEIKMTVEVDQKTLDECSKKATDLLQDQVKVEGFRKGHVPLEILKKKVGEQSFMSHVIDIALQESYEASIKQEKIQPVAYPKISIVSDSPLKYEAIVPIVPEVKLKKGIEKLELKPKKVEISESEMKEVLENIRTRSKKWTDVDRAVKKGDRVEIDFDGFDMEGVALEGTSSKNHPLVIGENTFIPGFEDEIVGMKKDEEKDFVITFPKDYHSKKFQSKKVKFHVNVNRIEEGLEQELDDAFIETLTGGKHKNLASIKEEIKEELTHQKEHDETARLENEFLDKLADFIEAEVPEALMQREKDFLKERIMKDLEKRQMTWEDYVSAMKDNKKDLEKELEEQAEKQILIRLGLELMYEQSGIEVTESEIEEEIEHMLGHYPKEYAQIVKEQYKDGSESREQIKAGVRLKKLVKKHTK